MSAYLNRQAAELLEWSARSHRRAANFMELGDTENSSKNADQGFEWATLASRISHEAEISSVENSIFIDDEDVIALHIKGE